MAGLGPCLYSQPKHATLLEENFLLHTTWLSKSTRKVPKNICCGLYKPLSLRITASPLSNYVALTPRNVISHCYPDLQSYFETYLVLERQNPDGGFGSICSKTDTEGTAAGYRWVWICPSPDGMDMGYSTFWSAPWRSSAVTALASGLKKQSFKPLQSSCHCTSASHSNWKKLLNYSSAASE